VISGILTRNISRVTSQESDAFCFEYIGCLAMLDHKINVCFRSAGLIRLCVRTILSKLLQIEALQSCQKNYSP
jgi:hypothetical protein